MTIVTYSTTLTLITCFKCAVPFGMSETLYEQRRRDRDDFWCPNGHRQHFTGEPTEAQLRRQLEYARGRNRHLDDQLEATKRSRRAYKGIVTKTKKKLAAGDCPAGCHATFPDLAGHLAAEHPDYAGQDGGE